MPSSHFHIVSFQFLLVSLLLPPKFIPSFSCCCCMYLQIYIPPADFIYCCMCVYVNIREQLCRAGLPLHLCIGAGNWTQVIRLVWQTLFILNHLTRSVLVVGIHASNFERLCVISFSWYNKPSFPKYVCTVTSADIHLFISKVCLIFNKLKDFYIYTGVWMLLVLSKNNKGTLKWHF